VNVRQIVIQNDATEWAVTWVRRCASIGRWDDSCDWRPWWFNYGVMKSSTARLCHFKHQTTRREFWGEKKARMDGFREKRAYLTRFGSTPLLGSEADSCWICSSLSKPSLRFLGIYPNGEWVCGGLVFKRSNTVVPPITRSPVRVASDNKHL
jgi:hypothetical protein